MNLGACLYRVGYRAERCVLSRAVIFLSCAGHGYHFVSTYLSHTNNINWRSTLALPTSVNLTLGG